MKRAVTIGLGVACLLFAVLSARLGIPALAYGVVATTILAVLLCVWGKLDKKWLPLLVFLLGLSFLYQTTLLSDNLIGTDIHTEYFVYQEVVNDGWDTTYPHAYNTAIGSTLIAPALTNYLSIPGYFIYKVIFPFLFAFVPLILFYLYRHEFTEKVAFIACVMFITLPTYTLEMIGLPRQMLGELMLAIGMLLLVVRPMRMRYLVPALIVALILGYLFHYVIGAVILGIFIGGFLVVSGMRVLSRWVSFSPIKFSLRWLALIIVLPAIAGFLYFDNVAEGVVTDSLSNSVASAVYRTIPAIDPHEPDTFTPNANGGTVIVSPDDSLSYFERQEPLIRTALGLDFAEASPTGKGFRIFQFGIQLSLIAGCVWLWFNRKKVSAEYFWLAVVAIVLMAAVILLPRFSNIINATRFYHIALFALAPLIVTGGVLLFRRAWIAVIVLIIPYLLFSTGVIFEVFGEEDIGKVNLPYSIALSNYRIGAVSEYTVHDKIVADWIVDNSIEPVLTDIGGMLLLSQQKEPFEYINRSQVTGKYYTVRPPGIGDAEGMSISELDKGWGYLPKDVSELPDGVYIFLTERSWQTETVTFKPQWYAMVDTASGMRVSYPFSFLGLQEITNIVYQSGDAAVLVTGG